MLILSLVLTDISEFGPGQSGEESQRRIYLQPQATGTHKDHFLSLKTLYSSYCEPRVSYVNQEGRYLVCKVDDNEGRVGHAWFLEVLAVGVPFIELLGPVLVSSFGDLENHKTGYSAT